MHRSRLLATLLAATLLVSLPTTLLAQQSPDADSVLQAVAQRLLSLSAIGFDHAIEFNYASQGYHHAMEARGYVEFDAATPLGVRFRFESPDAVYAYNGAESFFFDPQNNTISVTAQPDQSVFTGRYFQGSLHALRRGLPVLLAAEHVERVWLEAETQDDGFYEIGLRLPRANLSPSGELVPIRDDLVVAYDLKIDRASMLPVEVTKRDPNGDYMRTTLTAFDLRPAPLPLDSWYYSTLTNAQTRRLGEQETRPFLTVGEAAPDWTLAAHEDGREVSLADFQGQGVLLVFWISHCGHSIAAVPTVNAISRERTAIPVVSINPYDSPEVIGRFVEVNQPEYPILTQGQDVASAYGVPGYPAAVLVDGNGVVAYAGPVEHTALQTALEALR